MGLLEADPKVPLAFGLVRILIDHLYCNSGDHTASDQVAKFTLPLHVLSFTRLNMLVNNIYLKYNNLLD